MIILKHKKGQTRNHPSLSAAQVDKAVRKVLRSEKIIQTGEVNIIFVDNSLIKKLNRQFLGKNKTTDVIAFPYDRKTIRSDDDPFGDVYISLPEAKSNAKAFNEPYQKELLRLVVHGMLHILGYTDYRKKEKKMMWKKQEKLVDKLWLKNK